MSTSNRPPARPRRRHNSSKPALKFRDRLGPPTRQHRDCRERHRRSLSPATPARASVFTRSPRINPAMRKKFSTGLSIPFVASVRKPSKVRLVLELESPSRHASDVGLARSASSKIFSSSPPYRRIEVPLRYAFWGTHEPSRLRSLLDRTRSARSEDSETSETHARSGILVHVCAFFDNAHAHMAVDNSRRPFA